MIGQRSNLDQLSTTERRGAGQAPPDSVPTSTPATFALADISGADDLKAIEALTGTGSLHRTGSNTWVLRQSLHTTDTPQFARLGLGVAADATASLKSAGTTIPTSTATGDIVTAGGIGVAKTVWALGMNLGSPGNPVTTQVGLVLESAAANEPLCLAYNVSATGANAPLFWHRKGASGAEVAANAILGRFRWDGYKDGGYRQSANLTATVLSVGSSIVTSALDFSLADAATGALVVVMRLNGATSGVNIVNGNLTIGTTSETGLTGVGGARFASTTDASSFTAAAVIISGGLAIAKQCRVQTDLVVGSSIATNATTGFLYIPSCAGTPTGTPATIGSAVPLVVDRTNNKLYFYSGGAWRDAGP